MILLQLLKCEYILLSLLVFDGILSIFGVVDETKFEDDILCFQHFV